MAIMKMVADMEFKREKSLVIREGVRQEYDNVKSKLDIINTQLKSFPELKEGEDKKLKWTDEQNRVDDERVLLEKELSALINQMEGIDLDVNGSRKTNDYPDGYQGLNQQLEALRELLTIVKGYIKTL